MSEDPSEINAFKKELDRIIKARKVSSLPSEETDVSSHKEETPVEKTRAETGLELIINQLEKISGGKVYQKELEKVEKKHFLHSIELLLLLKNPEFYKLVESINEKIAEDLNLLSFDIYESFLKPKSSEEKDSLLKFNFSDDAIQVFYGIGSDFFKTSQLENALCVFECLATLSPLNPMIWLSLGICYHQSQDWFHAIKAYSMSALLFPSNPLPFIYTAQCYFMLQSVELTEVYLKRAELANKKANISDINETIKAFRSEIHL